MENQDDISSNNGLSGKYMAGFSSTALLLGLYFSSLFSYLLFHSLVEVFSIVIACGIFMVAWNARRFSKNNYLLFLGTAYLFIAGLDLIHTLGYKGMGVFPGYTTNLPTQLWIAARYMEGISLLIAPFMIHRKMRERSVFIGYTLVTAFLLSSIFLWDIFPVCFVEGVGLTPFKRISEYIISLILIGSLIGLIKKREKFDKRVLGLLIASICLTIGSEIAFTFYIHAYGLSNLIGHYFKLISFYLIYKAIIETAFVRPYDLLFKRIKKGDNALTESEKKYRTLSEKSPNPILMIDCEGNYIDCNQAVLDFLECKRDELLIKNVRDFIPPGREGLVMAEHRPLWETGGDVETEYLVKGKVKVLELAITPVGFQGEPIIFGLGRDITKRKRTEESLRKSEEKYRGLYNSINDGIGTVDMEGNILECNQAFLDMLGHTMEELKGKRCKDITSIKWNEMEAEIIENQVMKRGYSDVYEKECVRKDGTVFPVSTRVWLVRDENENPCGMWRIIRDISKQKAMEEQLRQSHKMEAIGLLAGGIAHDFNNLLQTINGYSEFISYKYNGHESLCKDIEEINKAGKRAASLTRQLLAFSRKQNIEPKEINLNDIISNMKKMLSRLIGEDIKLTEVLSLDIKGVNADPGQIEQVIMNLVVNARDAMPDGGKLFIKTEKRILDDEYHKRNAEARSGEFVCLTLEDTGVGMDDTALKHLFEPFYTTKGLGKGTGLGLSMVYGIVKQHEGWIEVESRPGHGTVFNIYLPAYHTTEKKGINTDKGLDAYQGKGERILVVEDEEQVRGFVSQVLEKNGYNVTMASTKKDALEIFKKEKERYHMVLTDMILPDGKGLDLAKDLINRKPGLAVLIASGYAGDKSGYTSIKESGFGFIQKPFELVDLLKSIKRALKEIREPSSSIN